MISTFGELVQLNLKHFRTLLPKFKNKRKKSNQDIIHSDINISVERVPSKKEDNESQEEQNQPIWKSKSCKLNIKFFKV